MQPSREMLKIPLTTLEKREYQADGQVLAEHLEMRYPETPPETVFDLSYTAYSLGKEKIVQGKISGALRLRCARCDIGYDQPFSVSFRHCYVPGTEKQLAETPEDGDFYFDDPLNLVITPGVREEILLQVPMKPIPGPELPEHCEKCEEALDVDFAPEGESNVDPRFAALQKLLKPEE